MKTTDNTDCTDSGGKSGEAGFRAAGWPERGSKVVWKGERITIDDVWQSRFGDWKISYSDDFGGGGIISLKYFKANA